MVKPIRRFPILSKTDFEQFFQNKEPIVIENLADNWPAMHKWSLEYFGLHFGQRLVPARFFESPGQTYKSVAIKLADYINYLTGKDFYNKRLYVADWEISKDFKTLLSDFTIPDLFEEDFLNNFPDFCQFRRTWIFLGHPGVHTPCHVDAFATSAFITQIFGHKQLRIASPEEPVVNSLYENVDPHVSFWEVTLKRGDTLYIPGKFPHEIKNLDVNLMVTKNFLEKLNAMNSLEIFANKYQDMIDKIANLKQVFAAQTPK